MLPDHLVVLVNGLPAAGKSTLAPALAEALGLPLLSKDVIKETHADVLGADPPDGRSQRSRNRLLGQAASETQWNLLAYAPRGAVVESSWRSDVRHFVIKGLTRARADRVIEVWCDVPSELAWQRDRDRWPTRHPIHGERMTDEERAAIVHHAEPLALGPVIRVDTSGPVGIPSLAARIRHAAC